MGLPERNKKDNPSPKSRTIHEEVSQNLTDPIYKIESIHQNYCKVLQLKKVIFSLVNEINRNIQDIIHQA